MGTFAAKMAKIMCSTLDRNSIDEAMSVSQKAFSADYINSHLALNHFRRFVFEDIFMAFQSNMHKIEMKVWIRNPQ